MYMLIFLCIMLCMCTVGIMSEKVHEKMPLKLTKLHNVSITTVTVTDGLVTVCVYVCVCMCVCMCVRVHACVCVHVCMCTRTRTCASLLMHTVLFSYSLIVTGDAVGCVKFFDHDLKMLNWYAHTYIQPVYTVTMYTVFIRYDNLKFGPIISISFANNPNSQKLSP